MNVHKNARQTPRGREWMVSLAASGQTPKAVSVALGVCPRTVRKWVKRHRDEGVAGLADRSSRPHRLYRPTSQPVVERIEALRRQRLTGKAIAAEVGVSPATVSRILKRLGLNKLKMLEPAEPVRRYERERPGELLHIDIKKLGKFNHIGHRITGDRTGQSNDEGDDLPMTQGTPADGALAASGAGIKPCHLGRGAHLVDEDQLGGIKRCLPGLPSRTGFGHVRPRLLG